MVRYFANRFIDVVEGTELTYTLKKAEQALIFQINYQSSDITEFLTNNKWRASNGILITSSHFPELKDSGNDDAAVMLYLRGSDTRQDYKLDVTRFASNAVRDNRYMQVKQALRELVDFVKKYASPRYFVPKKACGEGEIVVVLH